MTNQAIAGIGRNPFYELQLDDEHDEAYALRRELLNALDSVSVAIGTNDYLDLPDGGAADLGEQVGRMRADLVRTRSEVASHAEFVRAVRDLAQQSSERNYPNGSQTNEIVYLCEAELTKEN